jgi:hypothetical protein
LISRTRVLTPSLHVRRLWRREVQAANRQRLTNQCTTHEDKAAIRKCEIDPIC